ncbi:MAG: hypothetical protein J1F13_01155 [Prevotellaceae bacterium]|nr:hypothetical protein [Prevotellaceae bacterium]
MNLNKKLTLNSLFPKHRLHFLYLVVGIILCITFSSCHPTSYYVTHNVLVETNPNATIFWEDKQKIATADSAGFATINLSEYMYRKGYKKITVAKEGYEPQTVSLNKKFNTRVLYNVIFPYAFMWAHYKKPNFKKPNTIYLDTRAQNDAQSYLNMANKTKSKKKKVALLKKSIYQDPENENGVGIISTNTLSDFWYTRKDYEESQLWAKYGIDIDPNNTKSLVYVERARNAIIAKAERKRRRAEMWGAILSVTPTVLSTAASFTSIGKTNATGLTDNVSNSTSTSNKKSQTKTGGGVASAQNERTARKTYNDYVSQLIDMKTFPERYNDTQRRNIQSSMRSIRQQWGFPKSEMEDWGGK